MKSRFVCCIIYILTILDVTFTAVGLKLGIIEEANPIMNYLINISFGLSMLGVLISVGVILIFLYRASSKIPWLHNILNGLAGIKICIVLLHLRWISIYLEKR